MATASPAAEALTRRSDSAPAPSPSARGLYTALAVVVVLVLAFTVWLISPRFTLDAPSLTDDWNAIASAPGQLADVARLSNPERQRFRPGWILWNYLQWHTLDAPRGLFGPNLWNVGRALVLIVGLTLLTAVALRDRDPARPNWLTAGLAALPTLLFVSVPWFPVDLAGFGPQEPLLIGSMALGGTLLVLGLRRLLDHRGFASGTAALLVAGSVFWVFGVYQKEWSLAALPLVAAVCVSGRRRVRGLTRSSPGTKVALAAVAAVVLLPLVHVGIEVLRIVVRGDLVYDTQVAGGRGVLHGLGRLVTGASSILPPTSFLVLAAACACIVLSFLRRRTLDPFVLGCLLSALAMLVFAAQSDIALGRYYTPSYVLVAIALAVTLGDLSRPAQVAGIVAVLLLCSAEAVPSHDQVVRSTRSERARGDVVAAVSSLASSGCVVAAAGLEEEERQAVPVLASLLRPRSPRACRPAAAYLLAGQLPEGRALLAACAPGAASPLLAAHGSLTLVRCARLARGTVLDPELGRVSPARLVVLRRLRLNAAL